MKNWVKQIKKMKKDPKGRAVLFFGFYLLFFIFVILFVRFSSRNHTVSSDYEKGSSVGGQISALLLDNYRYEYQVIVDDHPIVFQGEKNLDEEMFSYQNHTYYVYGENCFVENGTWIKVEHPNIFSTFLNSRTIASLLEYAYFESKTSYESGKMTYNYLISTDTLNSILWNLHSDLGDEVNTIIIQTDENQVLTTITFQLNSYCKYHKQCQDSLKIIANYDSFGKVEKIENPIS